MPALFTCHLIAEANPVTCVTSAAKSALLLQVAGWLISFSLGVWQAQSKAGVYAEASAIVYTLGQSKGVTAIAKIAGGLVLLRM